MPNLSGAATLDARTHSYILTKNDKILFLFLVSSLFERKHLMHMHMLKPIAGMGHLSLVL